MRIAITNQNAELIGDDTLIQNSKKSYTAEFTFDETWEGFAKTVLFEAGPVNIAVVLTERTCAIPPECLKRGGVTLRIGVYGVNGEKRKPTVWCETSRILYETWGASGTHVPPPVSDDRYEEIMAVIGDLSAAGFEGKTIVEIITEIRECSCETADDGEVGDMLDHTFGQQTELPNPPCEGNPDNTATDQEVGDILDEVFGQKTDFPTPPCEGNPDNTATDQEVGDILNDVFGEQP